MLPHRMDGVFFVLLSVIGYQIYGWVGAILGGLTVILFFALVHMMLVKPMERAEELEEQFIQDRDEED